MSRRLRKGDEVVVIAGKAKGQKGRIVEVLTSSDRVRVEGVATATRHVKPGRDPKLPNGGKVEKLSSIHASNVMPVDPSTGKATRVKSKTTNDGKRIRVGKSGEAFKDA